MHTQTHKKKKRSSSNGTKQRLCLPSIAELLTFNRSFEILDARRFPTWVGYIGLVAAVVVIEEEEEEGGKNVPLISLFFFLCELSHTCHMEKITFAYLGE